MTLEQLFTNDIKVTSIILTNEWNQPFYTLYPSDKTYGQKLYNILEEYGSCEHVSTSLRYFPSFNQLYYTISIKTGKPLPAQSKWYDY